MSSGHFVSNVYILINDL